MKSYIGLYLFYYVLVMLLLYRDGCSEQLMVIEEAIRYIDALHEMLDSRLRHTELQQTHSHQCMSLYVSLSLSVCLSPRLSLSLSVSVGGNGGNGE